MKKSIITLVKEHDAEFNYHYYDYNNGKKYSYVEVQELRKTNIIVVV